jgi:hypothetical protein
MNRAYLGGIEPALFAVGLDGFNDIFAQRAWRSSDQTASIRAIVALSSSITSSLAPLFGADRAAPASVGTQSPMTCERTQRFALELTGITAL